MTLCIDCKFYGKSNSGNSNLCMRPELKEISPVNGAHLYPSCESERAGIDLIFVRWGCGPEAKHFQPKDK